MTDMIVHDAPDPMQVSDPMRVSVRGRTQCTAHTRTGNRCRRSAIAGGSVCVAHGGKAPQVRQKARLRLLELVEPAITTLAAEMTNAITSADRQRAANSILDRAGYARAMTVDGDGSREFLADLIIAAAQKELDAPR